MCSGEVSEVIFPMRNRGAWLKLRFRSDEIRALQVGNLNELLCAFDAFRKPRDRVAKCFNSERSQNLDRFYHAVVTARLARLSEVSFSPLLYAKLFITRMRARACVHVSIGGNNFANLAFVSKPNVSEGFQGEVKPKTITSPNLANLANLAETD